MIVSPFALWFIIGAVVGIYSLIDDLYISRNKDVMIWVINKERPLDLEGIETNKLYSLVLTGMLGVDILLGPVSIITFYRKTRKMKQFRAEMNGK